jgi:MFS family permease
VIGLVLSLGEIAGLAAATLGPRITRARGPGLAIVGAAALFGPSQLLLALAPKSAPIPFLVGGWAIGSFARVIYNSTATSLRQAIVPQRLQGRVVGAVRAVAIGLLPLGALTGGLLAAAFGLRDAMIAGAVIACLPTLPLLASPLTRLRELPAQADD